MTEEKTRQSMWITVRYVIYGLVVGLALMQWFTDSLADARQVTLGFPYAVAVIGISSSMIALYAVLGQYPIYGWFLGQAMRRGRFGRALLWLAGVHAAAVIVALARPSVWM